MQAKPSYEDLEKTVLKLQRQLSSSANILDETGRMAKIGGWEFDLETGKTAWTRSLYDILEFDGSEPISPLEHMHFYSEDGRLALESAIAECLETGKPFDLEVNRKTWRGREIWCRLTGEAVFEEGEPKKVRGTFQDITSRKQAEIDLRSSEQKYHDYISHAPYGVFVTNEQGEYLEVNGEACRQTGYSEEELLSMSILSLVPPESHEEGKAHFQKIDKNGKAYGEFPLIRKDGEVRWWSVFATKLSETRFLGYTNDITDRRIMEQELRRRENLISRVFDILPVGLWFTDKKGQLLRGNPMGQKIWGGEPTVGQEEYGVFKARKLPSGEEVAPDDWALAKTVNQGVTILDEMLEIEAFDGEKRVILNYTAPVLDHKGEVEAAVVVNLDITQRQKAEEEKQRLQRQLLQAQKMESVGRLAGGVAHDFNNMLGVIVGHAEMALDATAMDSEIREDLTEILDAAKRSANLTRQLLGFARKQTARPIVMNINEAVNSMLKMLRRLIGENIELYWNPSPDVWPVEMDPSQVDQILANLAVNVKDAIQGIGRMTIATYKVCITNMKSPESADFTPGDYVVLEVGDNGKGMDEETMHMIFEPFFTTKGVGEGTGLGLATVYGIVRQNKGFIKVESELGQGTVFRIYLPRSQKAEAALRKASPTPAPGTETILVVEDEKAILNMCAAILKRNGYQVLASSSPHEALEIVRQWDGPLDLVITDVVMPEMNGSAMKSKLEGIRPGLKHLFMSGYTSNVIAHHGVLDRGVLYIQKPFSVNDFLSKTRKVLDSKI
ncbi:PAS/PAC sensor hybrid histidine kinase [Desulfatibacillum aliphaticivorans]|uniref:histidine kinase n=1 Tax=Desulfatibacillum aliphaticivorans TaxID=218208 RepID=B8FKH9_DESAL|nr:PAS domain S-box protein [Desulfatibacillum aliphaticivorans]ACL01794.1 PAS/PAC sensor hybrid histidine kinase [Desulfatibacillum aliphaticivorans]